MNSGLLIFILSTHWEINSPEIGILSVALLIVGLLSIALLSKFSLFKVTSNPSNYHKKNWLFPDPFAINIILICRCQIPRMVSSRHVCRELKQIQLHIELPMDPNKQAKVLHFFYTRSLDNFLSLPENLQNTIWQLAGANTANIKERTTFESVREALFDPNTT